MIRDHPALTGWRHLNTELEQRIEELDQADHRIAQRSRQLAAVNEAITSISSDLDLEAVLQKIVQTHRAHVMEKLDAHERTDIVRHAVRLGIISPQD